MGMNVSQVWLVDASIYVFRAWFVRKEPSFDKNGQPSHAVLGFLRFVYNLLHTEYPTHLAFAFDTSLRNSIRKQVYTAYKANRSPAPAELKYQFQVCRDFLDALGIVQASSDCYEADDIIGTWAAHYRHLGYANRIISGDKDLTQLVAERDVWWDYGKRKALSIGGVKKEFGVWPVQIPEQLALAGDVADNIPGIPGIGMATAAKLLQKFASVEILLSRLPEVGAMKTKGAKRLQELVTQHQATVRIARQLTSIYTDVPHIPLELARQPVNTEKLRALCELLGLTEQQFQLWQNTANLPTACTSANP
jgi:5'-3' exonuclease